MPALPFKLNQARRHHIPEQTRKVTTWPDYDESLRQRGSLTGWLSDEAVEAWEAEHEPGRAARVFRPGDPDGAEVQGRGPAGVLADRRVPITAAISAYVSERVRRCPWPSRSGISVNEPVRGSSGPPALPASTEFRPRRSADAGSPELPRP